MKKILFIVYTIFILFSFNLFISCDNNTNHNDNTEQNSEDDDNDKNDTSENKPDDDKDKPNNGNDPSEIPDDSNKDTQDVAKIIFENKTDNILDVFKDSRRIDLIATIQSGKNYEYTLESSELEETLQYGVSYYYRYHVDVGIDVPWSDGKSFEKLQPVKNDTIKTSIEYPNNMEVKSAYVVIENDGNHAISFMQGDAMLPFANDFNTHTINKKSSAIYEISQTYVGEFGGITNFKVRDSSDGKSYSMPSAIPYFTPSTIYTLSFTGSDLQLVSVTPFNLDTKAKIWSMESKKTFRTDVLRSRYNPSNGSILGGFYNKKQPIVILIDEKGTRTERNVTVSLGKNFTIDNVKFIDLLETSKGDFVMLLDIEYSDDEYNYELFQLVAWNNNFGSVKWSYEIPLDGYDALMLSPDTKGNMIEIADNVFALCGATCDYDIDYVNEKYITKNCKYFIATVTYKEADDSCEFVKYDASESDEYGYERFLTSMWHDKTNSRIICTGYEHFNGNYTPPTHKGVVYAFSDSDITAEPELLYKNDACLFYGVDGNPGTSDFYVCGEICDAGNSPHGGFISSKMIADEKKPEIFNSKQSYGWLTQVCAESNRIVFCGQTSSETDGGLVNISAINNPWILAINNSDEKIWENFFDEYDSVYTCLKNGIGSFLVELHGNDDSSKIISTDLLGQDTGKLLKSFPN